MSHPEIATDATSQNPKPRPIAVVTGSSGGMGREIVADLVRDYEVIEISRRASPGHDLTSLMLPAALAGVERIDVLVHAAAIAHRRSIAEASAQDWDEHLHLNVVAPAILTRDLLQALRRAGGQVIFINSGAGQGAHPGNAVYAASKHALRAVADALRKEEPLIRVATVSPGPTDTDMLRGSMAETGQQYVPEHYIDPVEVAKAVRMVVDAGPSTQITNVDVRPRIELADRTDSPAHI